MTNRYSNPRISFLPLFLVVLSLALTLHDLATDSFWGDEIFTATFASQALAEVVRWTANDIHPPLYYLLVGTFTHLTVPLGLTELPTQVSDWLWRFPSVIFTVLTVAVTYRLALHISRLTYHASRITPHVSRLMDYGLRTTDSPPRLTATPAALLLCLAPIAIKYGQEARMHALFMFLSALSTWLFFRALARPQHRTRWLAFALATTANIYTMYFGFLILAAQAGLLVFWILDLRFSIFKSPITNRQSSIVNRKSQMIGFSLSTLLAFIFYLPWWPVLFNILCKRAAVGAIEGGVGDPLIFVRGVVQALGPMPEFVAWAFLILFITGLIFLTRSHWPLAAFAGLWLALPIALPIFLGDPRALQFRYAFVLPIYLTVIAYAVVDMSAIGRWNSQACHFAERSDEKSPVYSVAKRPGGDSSLPAVAQTCPECSRRDDINKHALTYILWLLATLSFIATLGIYAQTKPDWRSAAAYLDAHAAPADLILIGPLWDEGRFIGYYFRGQAQILTPAAMVTNIEPYAEMMRANGGRVWAVNRFTPAESPALRNIVFSGVVLSEPQLTVYEPELLTKAALDLAAQAVEAAYPWAAEAEAQGVLDPDPRTARAAALLAWGDALVAAGRPEEALAPYQTAVDIFPGWVNGLIALAETLEAVGNLAAAADTYRQAVAFNLEWQGSQADEAAAFVEGGQWEMALEKYHQIIGE
jgi:tetratricopeptide (TPR) repeat protein